MFKHIEADDGVIGTGGDLFIRAGFQTALHKSDVQVITEALTQFPVSGGEWFNSRYGFEVEQVLSDIADT
jgi:hypothetical protein